MIGADKSHDLGVFKLKKWQIRNGVQKGFENYVRS